MSGVNLAVELMNLADRVEDQCGRTQVDENELDAIANRLRALSGVSSEVGFRARWSEIGGRYVAGEVQP